MASSKGVAGEGSRRDRPSNVRGTEETVCMGVRPVRGLYGGAREVHLLSKAIELFEGYLYIAL